MWNVDGLCAAGITYSWGGILAIRHGEPESELQWKANISSSGVRRSEALLACDIDKRNVFVTEQMGERKNDWWYNSSSTLWWAPLWHLISEIVLVLPINRWFELIRECTHILSSSERLLNKCILASSSLIKIDINQGNSPFNPRLI